MQAEPAVGSQKPRLRASVVISVSCAVFFFFLSRAPLLTSACCAVFLGGILFFGILLGSIADMLQRASADAQRHAPAASATVALTRARAPPHAWHANAQ